MNKIIIYPFYGVIEEIYRKVISKNLMIGVSVEDAENISGISIDTDEKSIKEVMEFLNPSTVHEFEAKLKIAKKALSNAGIF